jgi:cell division protease FtsH
MPNRGTEPFSELPAFSLQSGDPGPKGTKGTGNRAPGSPGNGDEGGDPNRPGAPNMRPSRGLFTIVSLLVILGLLFLVMTTTQQARKVTWKQFTDLIETNQIKANSIVIRDTGIYAVQKPDNTTPAETAVVYPLTAGEKDFYRQQLMLATKGDFTERSTPVWTQVAYSVIPFMIIVVLLWFFIARGLRSAAGSGGGMLGNFGKSRHRVLAKEMTGVTFNDVAGIEEAKEEVTARRTHPARRPADRRARVRQYPPRQGHRRRGRCPLLLHLRL